MNTMLRAFGGLLIVVAGAVVQGQDTSPLSSDGPTLRERLAASPDRIVFETYDRDNWDLAEIRADGSQRRKLTDTPDLHELYPQVSPDGTKIAFLVDRGRGRQTARSVWMMNIDGSQRRLVAENARQPCWAPDSQTLAYLPQEYPKFNIVDYFTKGLVYYDTRTGQTHPHPNSQQLMHLYNPSFAANGKWIAATVHAGMGYDHTNLLVEAQGDRILNLGEKAPDSLSTERRKAGKRELSGCRPCLSPDGKRIAWGQTDHDVLIAELDLDDDQPCIGNVLTRIQDPQRKIYHVDWSPDGQFVSLSRGPSSKGDLTKPGTHEAACEMVGVYAKGWDILVVAATGSDQIDLTRPNERQFLQVTNDGESNKESDWYRPAK